MSLSTSPIQEIDSTESPSYKLIDSVFTFLRKSKERRPDIVVKFGEILIAKSKSPEVWILQEQLLIALLEMGDTSGAQHRLGVLDRQFPGSSRVKRLSAMVLEAQGHFTAAIEIYDKLISENPSNIYAMKRKVAIYRVQKDFSSLIAEIHNLIRLWPSDIGIWVELSDVHLCLQDYESASFCLEEILLIDPTAAQTHSRLADCYLALGLSGGIENKLKASKHYSISLDIQGPKSNLRALYGLMFTCKSILDSQSSSADNLVVSELLLWSRSQFVEVVRSGSLSTASIDKCLS